MAGVIVFDAFDTLFDVDGAARSSGLGDGVWPQLSGHWRRMQLEDTWLGSLARADIDFEQVTADALAWAQDAQGLSDPGLRARLRAQYRQLPVFPDALPALDALGASGARVVILSNGRVSVLADLVRGAGLEERFAAILSVDTVRRSKPARTDAPLDRLHGASQAEGCSLAALIPFAEECADAGLFRV
ncbi:MAG: HAD family hydrolase [Roseinatronobacter sp.]